MTEAEQRASVAALARKWIATPYHNCADVLGAGVDCGMLIVRVFVDSGMVEPFDPRPYAPDWMIHRDEEKYLGFFEERCAPVAKRRRSATSRFSTMGMLFAWRNRGRGRPGSHRPRLA